MKTISILISIIVLSGCATTYRPLCDMRGVHPARYNQDIAACQAEASRAIPQRQISIVSAIAWGLLGGAIGLAAGAAGGINDSGKFVALGAGAGAIGGASYGQEQAIDANRDYMRRCMAGKGYYVLD